MDTLAKLIICVVLGAFYSPAQAATYAPSWGELKVIDGDLHMTRGNGTTSIMYPDAGLSKSLNVSTSKGNFPVPVEKSLPIPPSKVAKAATRFLKTLPAISTAVALYDTVCDLTDLCRDQSSGEIYYSPELPPAYPPVYGGDYWMYKGRSIYAPTLDALCQDSLFKSNAIFGIQNSAIYEYSVELPRNSVGEIGGECHYTRTDSGHVGQEYVANSPLKVESGTCAPTYIMDGVQCVYANNPRPANEADWTTAETKLAAQPQQVAESLYNSNGPVPVDGSTQSAPVTKQISQTSTQTKDELGNVTGTQVETKTVKVEDTSTATEVTYNVTEITTITNYNENNQVTGTQTSTADTEQPKAAEDTDISFDNVSDVQLDTEEIDVQLETPVSWGEGTCPPDETLTLQGRSYAISYEPACEAAADLRPIFVLLASVTALFIVAGVSRSRGD